MNWLMRLLGIGEPAAVKGGARAPTQKLGPPAFAARSKISVDDGFLNIHVPGFEFFGVAASSPSSCWVVGCEDSNGRSQGGSRESGNGRIVLVDATTKTVALKLTCVQRPNNAHVADNGSFSVEDWRFGNQLDGEFLVFSATGEKLFQRKFAANIFASALSPCGKYACVQTAASPGSADDGLLELYDILSKRVLFSIHPPEGWAYHYRFMAGPGGIQKLRASLDDVGYFAYAADGTFLDTQKLEAARLEKGGYSVMISAAERLLKADLSMDAASRALAVVDKAMAKGASKNPAWAAPAWRTTGTAQERLGDTKKALAAYEMALRLNPKMGVKRRIEALRKRQATSPKTSS